MSVTPPSALTAHIADPLMRELFDRVHAEPWRTYQHARQLAEHGVVTDELALWQLAAYALEIILTDLDEHDEEHETLYGNHTAAEFDEWHREIEERIDELKALGHRSVVFAEFKQKLEGEYDAAAQRLVDEIFADVAQQQTLRAELMAAPPGDLPGLLRRIVDHTELDLDGASKQVATVAANNAVLAAFKAGDTDSALRIAQTYLQAWERFGLGADTLFYDELASNLLAIAIHTRRFELGQTILLKMVPQPPSHPRLAFNLACWHAVRDERGPMLAAVRHAIAVGNSASKFSSDADFRTFWNDPAFVAVLSESGAEK